MDQRTEVALIAVRTDNFRALCVEYGISAKTGYKWRDRLFQLGLVGLAEQSRRPRRHAAELGEAVVCERAGLADVAAFKKKPVGSRASGGKGGG